MRCPFCHLPETDVIDTRKLYDGEVIRRRRKCRACNRRFTTYERIESVSLMVVKKDGTREPYDREKIARGVRTACYRRPVSADAIEQLVNDVEATVMATDEQEISSQAIGDAVMRRLRDLDEVAYIRFASVYRAFADIGKLREAVDELLERERNQNGRMASAPSSEGERESDHTGRSSLTM
ncbi:transcriptional regulator NrdR [Chloroflexus sp.]|uniref:transcriptional regulator NrdR n=1 Tax=Chloroflexus sp. TaxID=1904827 RepID=UPI00298F069D|nr:transcriptional regulator NrdR [Chloroflexus sp.]MCS6889779.1 transcriptional regulator NrdR [Chloroflexus sp.]MDW8403914.1 transcriptional regulator NrdR [Chloroflexus sp.]